MDRMTRERSVYKCTLCGNSLPPYPIINSNSSIISSTILNHWMGNIATSLCNMLELDPKKDKDFFAYSPYCVLCQELICKAEFISNSFIHFQAQLKLIKAEIRAILLQNYKSKVDSIEDDDADIPIHDILRVVQLKIDPEQDTLLENEDNINPEEHLPTTIYNSDSDYAQPTNQPPGNPAVQNRNMNDLLRSRSSTVGYKREKNKRKKQQPQNSHGRKPQSSLRSSRLGRLLKRKSDSDPIVVPEGGSNTSKVGHDLRNGIDINSKQKKKEMGRPKKAREFSCPTCTEGFSSTVRLLRHLRTSHDPTHDQLPKCSICWKRFLSQEALQQHEPLHPQSESPSCVLCSKACETENELIMHVQGEHDQRKFICNFEACRKMRVALRYPFQMKTHLMTEHGMTDSEEGVKTLFHCSLCDLRCRSKRSLETHQAIHGEKPSVPCPVCGKLFLIKSQMLKHLRNFHTVRQLNPKCRFCAKSFTTPDDLVGHETQHSGLRPFDCVLCESKFVTTVDLHHHVHGEHEEHPFKCEMEDCGRSFDTKPKLEWHRKTHRTLEQLYPCPFCPYLAHAPSTLKSHSFVHTQEKPLACFVEGCDRHFSRKYSRDLHLRNVHSIGILETFHCKICGKACKSKVRLRSHEMHHGDERPFVCQICSGSFKTKQNLRTHMKVHVNEGGVPKVSKPRRGRLHKETTIPNTNLIITTVNV